MEKNNFVAINTGIGKDPILSQILGGLTLEDAKLLTDKLLTVMNEFRHAIGPKYRRDPGGELHLTDEIW